MTGSDRPVSFFFWNIDCNQTYEDICQCHEQIRQRSDYIIGFIAPAIGPNKSKKLTRLIAPAHNIRGPRQSLNEKQHTWLHRQTVVCEAMYAVFHSNFAACIVCWRHKPCEFSGFVWTDCWGNKSYYMYVITSPANWGYTCIYLTLQWTQTSRLI